MKKYLPLLAVILASGLFGCSAAARHQLPAPQYSYPQDTQLAKDLWYICTPAGWQQIRTSRPVDIGWVDPRPGTHPIYDHGPYLLGPLSPAETFYAPWDGYPKQKCAKR